MYEPEVGVYAAETLGNLQMDLLGCFKGLAAGLRIVLRVGSLSYTPAIAGHCAGKGLVFILYQSPTTLGGQVYVTKV